MILNKSCAWKLRISLLFRDNEKKNCCVLIPKNLLGYALFLVCEEMINFSTFTYNKI